MSNENENYLLKLAPNGQNRNIISKIIDTSAKSNLTNLKELMKNKFIKSLTNHFNNIETDLKTKKGREKYVKIIKNKYNIYDYKELNHGDVIKRKRFKEKDTRTIDDINNDIPMNYEYKDFNNCDEETIINCDDEKDEWKLQPRLYRLDELCDEKQKIINEYINCLCEVIEGEDTIFSVKINTSLVDNFSIDKYKLNIITTVQSKFIEDGRIIIRGTRENLISYLLKILDEINGFITSIDSNIYGYVISTPTVNNIDNFSYFSTKHSFDLFVSYI